MTPRLEKTLSSSAPKCPVETAIALIGGKYKSLILWKLTGRTLRFSELRREVPATAKMLTQQLRELEEDGFVHRRVYQEVPPRVEYSLTEEGALVRPLLESLYRWGEGWLARRGIRPSCGMTGDAPAPEEPRASRSCCCGH